MTDQVRQHAAGVLLAGRALVFTGLLQECDLVRLAGDWFAVQANPWSRWWFVFAEQAFDHSRGLGIQPGTEAAHVAWTVLGTRPGARIEATPAWASRLNGQ